MSLLDDVSIVVTPNGYKAGELYAVVPVPVEGAEEIVNGDFATDSDWSGQYSSISSGSLNLVIGDFPFQNTGVIQGTFCKISYEIKSSNNGLLKLAGGGSSFPSTTIDSSVGFHTYYLTTINNNNGRLIFGVNGFIGSIDNVSVKEYTAADMDVTRATAATRVDEDGLVNYAEIVGSEEVINGDFATDSDWTKGTGWTISSGVASSSGSNNYSGLRQSPSLSVSSVYEYQFTISSYTSGFVRILIGATDNGISISGVGVYSGRIEYTSAHSGGSTVAIFPWGDFVGSISNISVKESARDNVPRIDYSGGGCPHILAEPQRTNLLTYSEDFSQFSSSSIVLTTGQLAPDGSLNATKISGTIGVSSLYRGSASTTTATRSIYAKTVSGTGTARLTSYNANTNNLFNLTEEWQRFDLTGSISTGATNFYAADFRGSQTLSEFIIWGGQSEEGSYATSYIPTSGSTVTRNQDQFTRDGIGSLIGQTEGTFFIELSKPVLNFSTQSLISLNNAASNSDANSIAIGFDTGDDFFIRLQSNNVLVFQETETNADANTFYKVAISYKSGESLMYLNGSPLTPTSGNLSNAFTFAVILDNLSFDFRGDGALPFFGKVKQLQVYKTALTDTQLAALTS